MTISAGTDKDMYDGDDLTYEWPITFSVTGLAEADVKVYKTSTAGVSTLLTSNYSVNLSTPSVTYPLTGDKLATGEQIVILPILDIEQDADYKNSGGVPPEVLEASLDRIIRIAKQLDEKVSRSIQADISNNSSDTDELYAAIQEAEDVIAASAAAAQASAVAAAASAEAAAGTQHTFVDADLVAGVLTITHNAGLTAPYALDITVVDNTNKIITPDEITLGENSFTVDLSSYGSITGTWAVLYGGSSTGEIINTYIQDDDSDTKVQVEESADEDKIRFDTGGTQRAMIDSNGLTLELGAAINEFSIDETLAGASDTAVPTEQAVKAYVDSMVLKVKVGYFSRDISTATGTQAVTGVGFTPKAVIFLVAVNSTSKASLGFDDGTTGAGIYDDHAETADTWAISPNKSILLMHSSGNYYQGIISSLDADGFTVSWTKTGSPTGSATITYLAIK